MQNKSHYFCYHDLKIFIMQQLLLCSMKLLLLLCHLTQHPPYLHQQLSDDCVLPSFLRGLHYGIPAGLLVLQGLSAHRELHLPWRKQGSASPAGQHKGNGGLCVCWALSAVLQRFSRRRAKYVPVFYLDPAAAF